MGFAMPSLKNGAGQFEPVLEKSGFDRRVEKEPFGLWMLVEEVCFWQFYCNSNGITTIYVYSGSRTVNFLRGIRTHSGVIIGWVLVALFGVIG